MSLNPAVSQSASSTLATNKVLRNTYLLLSMTLFFSAMTAGLAMYLNLPPFGLIITLVGFYGLLFLTTKYSNRALGLLFVFALTGFMGLTIGPLLNMYISRFTNGHELIIMSLAGTATIFFALSGYALATRKDFSVMGGFLMTGLLVAFLVSIGAFVFHIPALSLAASGMFMMLSSGVILWETSNIIHGGETNYIRATVTLYVSLYNIFMSLLNILGIFGSRD